MAVRKRKTLVSVHFCELLGQTTPEQAEILSMYIGISKVQRLIRLSLNIEWSSGYYYPKPMIFSFYSKIFLNRYKLDTFGGKWSNNLFLTIPFVSKLYFFKHLVYLGQGYWWVKLNLSFPKNIIKKYSLANTYLQITFVRDIFSMIDKSRFYNDSTFF